MASKASTNLYLPTILVATYAKCLVSMANSQYWKLLFVVHLKSSSGFFLCPRLAYFTLIISRLLTCLFYESTINKLLSIESFWASYDQFFFPQGVNAEKWTHTYVYLCLRVFICVIWGFIRTIELNCIVKLYITTLHYVTNEHTCQASDPKHNL